MPEIFAFFGQYLHSVIFFNLNSRRLRYSAYRGAITFVYGKLGRRKRLPVPCCIGILRLLAEVLQHNVFILFDQQIFNPLYFSVGKIRELYPKDEDEEYVGFLNTDSNYDVISIENK